MVIEAGHLGEHLERGREEDAVVFVDVLAEQALGQREAELSQALHGSGFLGGELRQQRETVCLVSDRLLRFSR